MTWFTLSAWRHTVINMSPNEFVDTSFFRFSGPKEEQKRHWEANAFAADILMPKDKIVKQIANGNNNLVSLAETFGVTLLLMRWQLERTGLWDRIQIDFLGDTKPQNDPNR